MMRVGDERGSARLLVPISRKYNRYQIDDLSSLSDPALQLVLRNLVEERYEKKFPAYVEAAGHLSLVDVFLSPGRDEGYVEVDHSGVPTGGKFF